ncbi:hypothetical protein EUTSA_v10009762mg [Eutrema salsugineum]|uniref:F-box domain-containing protein n=1 Tax=Eutrema salsugineum TaxID=72664 RepID=V4K7Z2_EUTSA|nr:putative F-box protein At1g30925 [Eutrema salsugineum]ESQ33745.1 hypothetical protein EUTSA_v10009762mg [Eutrema salsugineum]
MKRRVNLDSFPTDLITEIFSRLPAKSVGRFRSLSKLWRVMLHRPYFTKLFLTRSSASPRLLFVVEQESEWCFFSLPQHHNWYDKSSLVVAAEVHTKFSKDRKRYTCSYASGLIYFPDMSVCNPITGQSIAKLSKHRKYRKLKSCLGFDPIGKQFKVLCMDRYRHRIMTLGTEEMSWRKIQCPFPHEFFIHEPWGKEICINGVLYYLVCTHVDATPVSRIVCFDVSSEKFNFIDGKRLWGTKLINYKGKLGGIDWKHDVDGNTLELCVWILEDVEKQEWSKYVYTLPANEVVRNFFVVGMTNTGEIILSEMYTSKRFNVFYFNPESNTLQKFEIQGFGENRGRVYAFADHVENLNFLK